MSRRESPRLLGWLVASAPTLLPTQRQQLPGGEATQTEPGVPDPSPVEAGAVLARAASWSLSKAV